MEAKNKIEYDEIKEKLQELTELTERVEKNLMNMNSIITETVGENVGVWDGESATQFRASWANIENEIPSYIKIFRDQVNNLQTVLDNYSEVGNMENRNDIV